jgi:SAM-dependent methyltransferase
MRVVGFWRRLWNYIALRLDGLFGTLLYRVFLPFYPNGVPQRSFEQIYRRRDPWSYLTSPYEQGKYEHTLKLVGEGTRRRALELGCSEGAFTEKLALHQVAEQIVGVDISAVAIERARERCARFAQVQFRRADILQESLEGRFDILFIMEILYYMGSDLRVVCGRLAPLLADGCTAVLVHSLGILPLHRSFQENLGLRLVSEHVEKRTPRPYVVTLLEKTAPSVGVERALPSPSVL